MGYLNAQIGAPSSEDEIVFYASTKQVNQFFRRFNNEESLDGKRYYEGDSLYRNAVARNKILPLLFDNSNAFISEALKSEFLQTIQNSLNPKYLDFHGGQWIAEVQTIFYYQKREEIATIYLELQEERIGSKWVIDHISFPPFEAQFYKDPNDSTHFLHPMSHELEFMNLFKVFHDEKEHIQLYTDKNFNPDYLALFLMQVKSGAIVFKTVTNLKFHFFKIDNWYFELSQVIRSGYNTGWLITDLKKVENDKKHDLLQTLYKRNE